MKSNIIIFPVLVLLCSFAFGMGDAKTALEAYPKGEVHLFLLVGQSNMAGRGVIDSGDNEAHDRVFALNKAGEWVPAVNPIHYDKSIAGVGPGKSFAEALAENDKGIVIGLIPAACGGSGIESWQPGVWYDGTKSYPYDDAVKRCRLAMEYGQLRGILWHQGEADCKPERSIEYEARLEELIGRFRKDLDAEKVPFILGELGGFYQNGDAQDIARVNDSLRDLADKMPQVGFVSSENLTSKSDHVHFNTESQVVFGRRYAQEYLRLTKDKGLWGVITGIGDFVFSRLPF